MAGLGTALGTPSKFAGVKGTAVKPEGVPLIPKRTFPKGTWRIQRRMLCRGKIGETLGDIFWILLHCLLYFWCFYGLLFV